MDSRGLKVTKNLHFSLLPHTKQLLLVTFCDEAKEIENLEAVWTDRCEGWNSYEDVKAKIEGFEKGIPGLIIGRHGHTSI